MSVRSLKQNMVCLIMLISTATSFAASWTQNVINDTEEKYYYGTDNPATINAHSTVYLNWKTPDGRLQNIADSDGNIIAYFDDTGLAEESGYYFGIRLVDGGFSHCYLAGTDRFCNVGLNVHLLNNGDITIENGDAPLFYEVSYDKCLK